MEDQLNLLAKYLQLYDEKKYKEKIYEFSYSTIVGHFIECEIYKCEEGRLLNQNTVNKKLRKIILEADGLVLKVKLIPLVLFLGDELWNCLMNNNYFEDMHSILLGEFKLLSFEPHFEQVDELSHNYVSYQGILNGIKERKFKEIIDFNPSPNIGNNQYNNFIYLVANEFFFDDYCQSLDKKDDFTFLFLLNSLEYGRTDGFDKRLKILDYLITNKNLLLIKLFEDILLYGENEEFIYNTIMHFALSENIWKQFINFYLEYPSRHPKIFKVLSKVIDQLDEEKINLLLDGIKIHKYMRHESKGSLNICFFSIHEDNKRKYCLEFLFKRWNDFIDTPEGCLGSLTLTDVIDLVIVYIMDFLNEKEIVQSIEKLLYDLEEIDNKWFASKVEYSRYFYVGMTRLFAYGVSLKKYNLHDLKKRIFIICNGKNMLIHEKKFDDFKTTQELFKDYIL